jgi:segregation and condensation protein A
MTEEHKTPNEEGRQEEMPFAVVLGEPITQLPQDLYIPPEALEVFLAEAFEGPLDLLLYLIRRQNLDILDIPVAKITEQYMAYIEMMEEIKFELAAEYMLMAAMLAEIKSRMLLPRPKSDDDGEEEDPRAELVRRLQEYERYKQAAQDLDELPRIMRDTYQTTIEVADRIVTRKLPEVPLDALLKAFADVMKRAAVNQHHHIQMEALSVRERMSDVLGTLSQQHFTAFQSLFRPDEGRQGIVVTFLAVLELIKESLVVIQQADVYGEIHVKIAAQEALPEGQEDISGVDDQYE